MPRASNASIFSCNSTSCVRQGGHQTAERKNNMMVGLDSREKLKGLPNTSWQENAGSWSPISGPVGNGPLGSVRGPNPGCMGPTNPSMSRQPCLVFSPRVSISIVISNFYARLHNIRVSQPRSVIFADPEWAIKLTRPHLAPIE